MKPHANAALRCRSGRSAAVTVADAVVSNCDHVLHWDEFAAPDGAVVTAAPHGRVRLLHDFDDLSVMGWLLEPRAQPDLHMLAQSLGVPLPAYDHLRAGDALGSVGQMLVSAANEVHDRLRDRLARDGLVELYDLIERPLGPVLREMEATGIPVVKGVIDISNEEPETQKQWRGWPARFTTVITSRVHPIWCQARAVTGRISAREPAMQSLPKTMRCSVVAPPGKVLVAADYSAADFRAAAGLSRDPDLRQRFADGQDPYIELGQWAGQEARGRERAVGKGLSFRPLYGADPWLLAEELELSVAAVERATAEYKDHFSRLWEWREEIVLAFRRHRMPRNPWGRLLQPATHREAINYLCQSSVADIMKLAMIRLRPRLSEGAAIIAQIHDELLIECWDRDVELVKELVRGEMTRPLPELPVRWAVKVGVGSTWAEATAG
jgi:DNA polymerase I-like protein with 3'-5' exonuclease and polymerase domains